MSNQQQINKVMNWLSVAEADLREASIAINARDWGRAARCAQTTMEAADRLMSVCQDCLRESIAKAKQAALDAATRGP